MASASLNRRSFITGTAAFATCGAMMSAVPATQARAEGTAGSDWPSWLGEPPVVADDQISDTVEADVVVVGGGNAGVMCACAAAEEGATVAVLETQAQDAIWYYGLHDIASLNSNYSLEHGSAEIRKSEFVAEYQRRTHNRSNPKLIGQFADKSGEMIDWLIANGPAEVADKVTMHGDQNPAYFEMGAEVNRFTCWTGTIQYDFNTAAPALIAAAEERGAQWFWETKGVVLLTEETEASMPVDHTGEDGSLTRVDEPVKRTVVTGVIGQNADGDYVKFVAKKGVVLAAGDFGGNAEMFEALMDEHRNLNEIHGLPTDNLINGMFGRDGSGIKMGLWAGGSMDPNRVTCQPNITFRSDVYATNLLRWGSGFPEAQCVWGSPFMWVDSDGHRFTDETFLGAFGQVIRAERLKPGRYYTIIDNNYAEFISRMPPEHFCLPTGETHFDFESLFASWLERGPLGGEVNEGETVCCWGAQTLDELFGYMGLEDDVKANLSAEIERYNGFCAAGEDEDFGRDPKMLLPIEQGPFYAVMSVNERPMVGTVTLSGLVIDDGQRVLDKNFNPIDGLYATGNCSGGRFAIEYSTPMQGLTLGLAMTHGRELGKALAKA